jgi:hypothetical protein
MKDLIFHSILMQCFGFVGLASLKWLKAIQNMLDIS